MSFDYIEADEYEEDMDTPVALTRLPREAVAGGTPQASGPATADRPPAPPAGYTAGQQSAQLRQAFLARAAAMVARGTPAYQAALAAALTADGISWPELEQEAERLRREGRT
jgi:hypothetical protein